MYVCGNQYSGSTLQLTWGLCGSVPYAGLTVTVPQNPGLEHEAVSMSTLHHNENSGDVVHFHDSCTSPFGLWLMGTARCVFLSGFGYGCTLAYGTRVPCEQITYIRPLSMFFSFGGSRSAAEEAVPEEAPGIRASSGRSFVADKVSLACQPGIDGNERRDQTQQTLGSPDLEVQEITVSNSKGTDSTDGDCDADDNVTNDQEQPGVWGPNGLLAVPGVRMVLFLCLVTQVRWNHEHQQRLCTR